MWLAKNVETARNEGSEADLVVSENSAANPPRRRTFQKTTRPAKT